MGGDMATGWGEATETQTAAEMAVEGRDDSLAEGLRAARAEAFDEFVALYQTPIYNLALRILQDREDARDTTQEVFLKAYRQLPKLRGELRLRPWVYRVTVNACYDHLRASRRRPQNGDAEVELREEPVDRVEQAELGRLFRASLRKLSERQQIALLLKDVHGLPHSEIAECLGISRGSAEVLLFRARHSFRRAYAALSAAPDRSVACTYAERMAAEAVGGRLSEARQRRIVRHAEHCPECRRTVEGWGGALVGLGVALPVVATAELFHASAASAAATAVASHAAASAAGVAAAVSGSAAGIAAVAAPAGTAAATGFLTKLGALFTVKAATVATAATCVVAAGGVTAYEVQCHGANGHGSPPPWLAVALQSRASGLLAAGQVVAAHGLPSPVPSIAAIARPMAAGHGAGSAAKARVAKVEVEPVVRVHSEAARVPGSSPPVVSHKKEKKANAVARVSVAAQGHLHTEAMKVPHKPLERAHRPAAARAGHCPPSPPAASP
jgi:RNA polymerase sigma-70 factor (ECF subfamily)